MSNEDKIKQLEEELIKLKMEKIKLEKEKRLQEKPWESRSKQLDEELTSVIKGIDAGFAKYRIKSAITTIISKSLNKKNVCELNKNEIEKAEPFIQQVLIMLKDSYKKVV
ncbi:hypothetical protein [Clostridium beijerinckii]|uniref:hypothetical protein n=1 Tax=Clostridium beijerinckii TaxID=1520 RepID=UPI00156EAD2B|nr:hypothetical protein [Clostridium beijerinckii]NRU52467.1 uncharacterized protein with von Willebrand factor type A (vWA) domain [Clostridium beijerinckii]NYC69088.1 uncharacterized protein with von Willebrand factor type A (vWA) domain [Clostridium beijerinckii]